MKQLVIAMYVNRSAYCSSSERSTPAIASSSTIPASTTKAFCCRTSLRPMAAAAELKRTKPYSFSPINLDAIAGSCRMVSTPGDDLSEVSPARRPQHQKGDGLVDAICRTKSPGPMLPDVQLLQIVSGAPPHFAVRRPGLCRTRYLELCSNSIRTRSSTRSFATLRGTSASIAQVDRRPADPESATRRRMILSPELSTTRTRISSASPMTTAKRCPRKHRRGHGGAGTRSR